EQILDCGTVFNGPAVATCIVITPTGRRPETPRTPSVSLGTWAGTGPSQLRRLPTALLQALPDQPLFSPLEEDQVDTFRHLAHPRCRLRDLLPLTGGMECGKTARHVRRTPADAAVPVLSGEGVRAFRIVPQGLHMPLGLPPRSRYKDPELFRQT